MGTEQSVGDFAGPVLVAAGRARLAHSERLRLGFAGVEPTLPPELTRAERAVALALWRGLSHEQIAAQRATAVRTVAKQIAAVYRKLGVQSRFDLVRQLALGVEPDLPLSGRAVSARARRMLAQRARGHSLKLIAFEFGVSISTVSRELARSMSALGIASTVELVKLTLSSESS